MGERNDSLIGQAAHGRMAGIIVLTAWPIRGIPFPHENGGKLSLTALFYEFPEKNNNFLKKLRLLHFRFIFLPNIFLVSAKDPRITKKYWLSQKGQPGSALIFLEMVSLFSGFLVKFSKQ